MLIIQPSHLKLGKLAPKIDNRTLKMASYITNLPPTPAGINWYNTPENQPGFKWEMFRNDELGDCAIAGPAHIEMVWTGNTGNLFVPTDAQVVNDYCYVGGYRPGEINTDNGCILLNVMNYWRNTGICGKKILGYVSINPKNIEHIKAAIYLFGAINIGVALPISAQSQVGQVWTVTDPELNGDAAPGSWGGHCVIVSKYDAVTKKFTCITWGEEQEMTFDYFTTYCDEAYAPLSPNWINAQGIAPNGFNINALTNDLSAVR